MCVLQGVLQCVAVCVAVCDAVCVGVCVSAVCVVSLFYCIHSQLSWHYSQLSAHYKPSCSINKIDCLGSIVLHPSACSQVSGHNSQMSWPCKPSCPILLHPSCTTVLHAGEYADGCSRIVPRQFRQSIALALLYYKQYIYGSFSAKEPYN